MALKEIFKTFVNPVSLTCSIWLLMCHCVRLWILTSVIITKMKLFCCLLYWWSNVLYKC